jgi:RNA polymerase sigma-70 factor (ECF subfamily)
MLGSGFDAEDAVQETMVRAWRNADGFEGRSSVRSWLYRIANNVCIDMLRSQQRRARPIDLGPPMPPTESSLAGIMPDGSWVSPIADERILPPEADPAELAEARESVRLAFVAALQQLPARQRSILILCEVLRWQATEVADLLDTSVAAVNSALQRARATLATDQAAAPVPLQSDDRNLLAKYVDAFERYDIDELVTLLHTDAVQSMPPYSMWLQGAADISTWMLGPGSGCRGSRLIETSANGCPAAAQYRPDPNGGHAPWALHVFDVRDGKVAAINTFLDVANLFPLFGLPAHLPE